MDTCVQYNNIIKLLPNSFGAGNNAPILQKGQLKLKGNEDCPKSPCRYVEEAGLNSDLLQYSSCYYPNASSEVMALLTPQQGPLGDSKKQTNIDRPQMDWQPLVLIFTNSTLTLKF